MQDKIPVMTILHQRQMPSGNARDDSDGEVPDNQLETKNKVCSSVLAALALTEPNKENPPALQQQLEAEFLDLEWCQTLKVIDKIRSDFTVDANSLLEHVAPLDRAVQIYSSNIYQQVVLQFATTRCWQVT